MVSQRVSTAPFLEEKCIFLTKLSVPCGGPGLSIYRAPASKLENCMVAAGPLPSFFQATDHKHSNFTMVTCFIPTASLAPTVWDSWHSIYLANQFQHADQLLFISHSVLRRKALCIEKMVHTDEKWWFGMSIKVRIKLFLSVSPHSFLQVHTFTLTSFLWISFNLEYKLEIFWHLLLSVETVFLMTLTKSGVHTLSMNNHWSCSNPDCTCKDPFRLHGFDCAIAPFHTNGNDAFCFSVTGERLPIFRSHCQVVHSCISLHTCVWGTGNDCWQYNGSMRMQYKSLIMPESWTAAHRSTHHSAGTAASRESIPCEVLWLLFLVFLLFT